jgi:hypothetical protein
VETQTDWGNAINAMARHEKFIVLGVIASKFAYDDGETLDWHYRSTPPLYFVADLVPVPIATDNFIQSLDGLDENALLGLCSALVAQLRTKEVAS